MPSIFFKVFFKSLIITTPTLIGVVGLIFIDNYKMGIDYYNEHDYERAYKNFEQVKSGNKNYADAITKMNEIRPIVDSLRISAKNADLEKKYAKKAEKLAIAQEKEIINNPLLVAPKTEQDFIAVLTATEQEYKEQPNELKKSAVRTKRGNLIKNALGNTRHFSEWNGVVKNLETTSKGKAIFVVDIEGTSVTIMTMNNEFSDVFDNTLIEQGNPLFNIISELKKGDKVRVSGEFVSSPNNDYVYELSITEAGSMKSPDFIVKFDKVVKR